MVAHIAVLLIGGLVTTSAFLFVVVDMFGRVDYLKDKAPWLERILAKRSAMAALMLVSVFLLIFDGSELYQKELPQEQSVLINLPAPPAPQIVVQVPEGKTPHLNILYKKEPLNGKVFYFDAQKNLNLPDPIQIRNTGTLSTQRIGVRVSFSEVVALSARPFWDSSGTGDDRFPFELWVYGPVVLDPGENWLVPSLVGRKAIEGDKPIIVKVRVFYGSPEPAQAIFRIEKPS
jgi:hypothetical protein